MHTMHRSRHITERELLAGYPPPLPYSAEYEFLEACGLRRSELLDLRVRDIHQDEEGRLWIHVPRSRRRGSREVLILAGHEQVVLGFIQDARLFSDLPRGIDVQHHRKQYASMLYSQLLRITPQPYSAGKYNIEVVRAVMRALGHTNLDVVSRYYLHLWDKPLDHRRLRSDLANKEP